MFDVLGKIVNGVTDEVRKTAEAVVSVPDAMCGDKEAQKKVGDRAAAFAVGAVVGIAGAEAVEAVVDAVKGDE